MTKYKTIGDFIIAPGKSGILSIITPRGLRQMTDDQLDEEIRNAYDRWTWDSGKERDKKALELLEKERDERKELGVRVEKVKTSTGKSTIKRVHVD